MENKVENKETQTHISRKWIIAVWAMTVGTVIVLTLGVCAIIGRPIPEGFGGLATLLFSTGIAYIGGNVWQKNIDHKETR